MPELRKDPVVGRWVIIATERARRPSDFVAQPVRPVGTECVFCAGNEHKTPPEILAGRSPGSRPNEPGWSYRVVANKFPALRIEGELEPDRKSTRLNSSHSQISYAVFCLKKKKNQYFKSTRLPSFHNYSPAALYADATYCHAADFPGLSHSLSCTHVTCQTYATTPTRWAPQCH